jgi:hypothetical protein
MDKEWGSILGGCAGVLVVCVLMLIFGGAINFGLGWLGGWLVSLFIGDFVADGLNMVLGNITNHAFTSSDIPLFFAIMTTIGGFFKSTTTYKSKD